jgi:hypothetical protein
LNEGALLVAYHGCDITTRDRLVSRTLSKLDPSANVYDWLGPGVYFFEDDAERAERFAQASHSNPDKFYTKRPIATPAVVGAVLCVSRWLDMTTQLGMKAWLRGYEQLVETCAQSGSAVPENRASGPEDDTVLLRQLDCAVFTALHQLMAERNQPPIQAVRGASYQGEPLARTSSEFREQSHIQIAVSEPRCIVGWFLPKGARLLPPAEFDQAQDAYDGAEAALTSLKPRRRAAPRKSR